MKLLRGPEVFSGVRIATVCVMFNHFHVLVEVPQRPEQMPDDRKLLDGIGVTAGHEAVVIAGQLLDSLAETSPPCEAKPRRHPNTQT